MIVVDGNVLVYIETPAPQTAVVTEVFARDNLWAAPPLWRSEFRNALAGAIRTKGLSLSAAQTAFDLAAAKIGAREIAPGTARLFRLIAETSLTAYDLEYVAVAEALGVPLVTYDRQILEGFPTIALRPAEFLGQA